MASAKRIKSSAKKMWETKGPNPEVPLTDFHYPTSIAELIRWESFSIHKTNK